MSDFNAGSARGTYILDISQAEQAAARLKALFAQIKADAAGLGGTGGGVPTGGGPAVTRAAIAQQRLATETQRTAAAFSQAAVAGQRLSTEQQRTAVAASNAAAAQSRAEVAALRLARAQEQGSRSTQFGASIAGAFKDQMLGFVGPLALVTTGLALATRTVQSFGEAFNFKTQLDATNQSIAAQLAGVRDSGRVFEEASRFGDKYRITQAETSQILLNSVGILRASTSSVADLEATLLRLQSRDPSKPISEAARALRELNSGDTATIKDLFNIGAADAQRMKNEIAGGADAVQVLSQFLTEAGNGMEVLEQRTRGAMGAINARAQAEERLRLAQAAFAEGPGLRFLQLQIDFTNGLTNALTLNAEGFNEANRAMAAQGAAQVAYNDAIRNGASEQEAQAAATQAYADKARELEPAQNAVARALLATGDAANALVPVLKDTADAHLAGAQGAFAQTAQLDGLSRQARRTAISLMGVRASQIAADAKGRQESNASGIQRLSGVFGRGAGRTADDLFERQAIERERQREQLAAQQVRTARAHTSELGQQLNLSESIYDSQQKQYRAALDLEELTIRNRQETRAEDDKIRRLQNTANTATDPRIRAAAQDALALINVQQRQRAAEIAEKQGITGAPIVNGRILESLRGTGAGGSGTAPVSPGVSGGASAGAGAGGALTIVNQFYVDSKLLLEVIEPQIIANALAGQRASLAGGGGRGAP